MKKTLMFTALAAFVVGAAMPIRADITPTDVKEGAQEKGETIEKNTKQAGEKAGNGARRSKDAGNRGAHKLRDKKDKAKADWQKEHPNAAEKADSAGDAAIDAGEKATDATK